MSDRKFLRVLLGIVIAGLLLSICHVIYIILAYPNSSIIYYISKELWL
ncbi:MAG: hypothetical protein J6S95_05545 [Lachnospiraceae bacterium]|nr:hypothetical protein [Lachnospiraceae bacterium]